MKRVGDIFSVRTGFISAVGKLRLNCRTLVDLCMLSKLLRLCGVWVLGGGAVGAPVLVPTPS